MGTILTFKNNSKEYEVIDGQQRIVTFLLMLRAFYRAFAAAQDLPPLETELHIEHILARKRQELHRVLTNPDAMEFLGNKTLLEGRINIRAADSRLADKKFFYIGNGKANPGTFNRVSTPSLPICANRTC